MTAPVLDRARGTVLLSGIVGSTAYGMARPDSDVDTLGFYAAPTVAFHGLNPPTRQSATIERKSPDVVLHEAGKYAALALAANPTVTELLWLEPHLYLERTDLGQQLIDLRYAFLSKRAADTYLGYATAQFDRLTNKQRFPNVPVDRIRKHARHLLRLVDAGTRLWVTGDLQVRVDDPARYFEFADRVADDPSCAQPILARARLTFDTCRTPLPDTPDTAAVERWLLDVRAHHYTPQER